MWAERSNDVFIIAVDKGRSIGVVVGPAESSFDEALQSSLSTGSQESFETGMHFLGRAMDRARPS